MLKDDICKFYKTMVEKNKFDPDFMKRPHSISSKAELENFIREHVCPLAKSMGYDFTVEDLMSYEIDVAQRLSEEELENISGGIEVKNLVLGGVVSLLTVGGGVLLSGEAHAELSASDVAVSHRVMLDKIDRESADTGEEERLSTSVGSVNEMSPSNGSEEEKPATDTVTAVAAERSSIPEEKSQTADEASAPKEKLADTEKSPKSEVEVLATVKESTRQSTTEKVDQSTKLTVDQKNYVLKAANMQDAYSLLQSGVIENLRLYGNLSDIEFNKDGGRQYSADKGDAFSEVLFQLFPSPAGELNTAFGGDRFSFSKNPVTPELMAKLFAILNDYRNGKIVTDKQLTNDSHIYFSLDLGRFQRSEKENFLSFYDLYKVLDSAKELEPCREAESKLEEQIRELDLKLSTTVSGDLRPERERLEKEKINLSRTIDAIKNEFSKNLLLFVAQLIKAVDLEHNTEAIKALEDKLDSLKTKSIRKKIEILKSKIYPQYLTEKILMSYMIKTLNTREEIEKFYSELKVAIAQNKTNASATMDVEDKQLEELESEKERLEKLNAVIDGIKIQSHSPYKNTTVYNSSTKLIRFGTYKAADGSEVVSAKFHEKTFQDCADVTLRHAINLLSFPKKQNWNTLLDGADVEDLKVKLAEVIEAIETNGEVTFYDLRTRLQMFFLYQSEFGADDASMKIRTLWEYAICNMNEANIAKINKGKSDAEKLYPLVYNQGVVEFNPGYVNLLKAMYNIASALGLGKEKIDEEDTKLAKAKTAIGDLLKSLETKKIKDIYNDNAELAIDAVKVVFSLFAGEEIEVGKSAGSTLFQVTCNEVTFKISQESGHAYVEHIPFKLNWKEEFKERADDFSLLLLKHFVPHKIKASGAGFYVAFSGSELSDNFTKTDIYKKYKALHVLDLLHGEESNLTRIYSIIDDDVLNGAELINAKYFGDNCRLFDVLYKKYLVQFQGNYDYTEWYDRYYGFVCKKHAYTMRNSKLVNCKGLSYINLDYNNVKLFITNETVKGDELFIPSKVYDESGRELNVTKVMRGLNHLNCKTVKFDDAFENLPSVGKTFTKNINIERIIFPKQLKKLTIESDMFKSCYGLSKFDLSSLENTEELDIKENAFECCRALEAFIMPKNLESLRIRSEAFSRCGNLSEIVVWGNNVKVSIVRNAFKDCNKLSKVDLHNIAELSIDHTAFINCDFLENFIISGQLEALTLEDFAFKYCQRLKRFDLSQATIGQLNIGNYVFADRFERFVLPEDIGKLYDVSCYAFYGCKSLRFAELPAKVREKIWTEEQAYTKERSELKGLSYIKLSDKEAGLFITNRLVHKGELYIPSKVYDKSGNELNVTSIGSVKKFNCNVLHIEALEKFPSFYDDVIFKENVERVIVSGSLKIATIKVGMFIGYDKLKEINLLQSEFEILNIEEATFSGCQSLEKVYLPKKLSTLNIGKDAFLNCKRLRLFCLPFEKMLDKVSVDRSAFSGCSSIGFEGMRENLCKTVWTEDQAYTKERAELVGLSYMRLFDKAVRLFIRKESIQNDELYIPSKIYDKAGNELNVMEVANLDKLEFKTLRIDALEKLSFFGVEIKSYEMDIKKIIVSGQCKVLTLKEGMFNCYARLKSIDLSQVIAEKLVVEDNVFKEFSFLESFILPKGLIELVVGKKAFNMCAAFTGFDLSQLSKLNKVSIAQSAFSGCTLLESFILPKNVREVWIGKQAFEHCTGLQTICLPELIELKSKYIGDFKVTSIDDWSASIKDRFVFIGESAFAHCGVESVNISGKQVIVGKSTFSNCKRLQGVNIFSWDVKILENAFSRCAELQEVVLPKGEVPGIEIDIKRNAFEDCPKLRRADF